jgi:hypothetical protein
LAPPTGMSFIHSHGSRLLLVLVTFGAVLATTRLQRWRGAAAVVMGMLNAFVWRNVAIGSMNALCVYMLLFSFFFGSVLVRNWLS